MFRRARPLATVFRFVSLLASLVSVLSQTGCEELGVVGNCAAPTTRCGNTCADLSNDSRHCGACDNACPVSFQCVAGACVLACPGTLTACSGACVDTSSDRAHCGACGKACADGEVCSAGQCALSCPAGLSKCGNACVNTQNDPAHCGACGKTCAAGEVCAAGKCALSCQSGLTSCNGTCRDLQTDLANCGACGTQCKAGEVCSAGKCAVSCQAGLTDCSGSCRDLQTDPAHCGMCGAPCKQGEVCNAGKCAVACQAGLSDCNGSCRDLQTDLAHCGGCDAPCKVGEVCSMGKCAANCAMPLVACGGRCVDTRFDPAHCGGCDKACSAPNAVATCTSGACDVLRCQALWGDCNKMPGDGCETPLGTLTDCGGCARPCAVAHGTATCATGTCAIDQCNAGWFDCDMKPDNGCEANVNTDSQHCGACGMACAMGSACCNGKCIDPATFITDANNCGVCGNACAAGGSCCGGRCYAAGETPDCADCTKTCNGNTVQNGDFSKGNVTRLDVDPMGGLVTVSGGGTAGVVSPIVWAVLHDSNFANRLDAQTGKVLGVYFTRGGGPSRTTVALDDTLWIAHRCPNDPNNASCSNVVQLNPDGTTGCIVSKAADGAAMPFVRAIAVDAYGYVWAGTWNDHRIHKIDPLTCKTVLDVDMVKNGQTSHPYGFAIDSKGKLWMSTLDAGPWMSVDTNTGQIVDVVAKPYNSYGVVVDRNDNAYFAEWCRNGINRVDGATKAVTRLDLGPWFSNCFCARGMAIDSAGDIWASIAGWNCTSNTTYGFKIQGGTLNRINHWTFNGVTAGVGIAGDSYGRIWQTGSSSNTIARLNKDTGATELSAALIGTNAYNYSDWTGYALKTVVTKNGQLGTWNYTWDGGGPAQWQKSTWTATLPPGTSARLRFRAAATVLDLQNAVWCNPVNASPADLRACNFGAQRYLQAQVFLTTKDDAVKATLNDLKVYWQAP